MSIDVLQKKIRELKNPAVLHLALMPDQVPEALRAAHETDAAACGAYARELLDNLKDLISAVRVSFDAFTMLGSDGLGELEKVLSRAEKLGYYVILDWMHQEEPRVSRWAAEHIFAGEKYPCSGICLCPYSGSEGVKPYIEVSEEKTVFVSVRTGNKSGSELQDLQTGGRQVYIAAADLISRWGSKLTERCGYSRVAAIAGAGNAGSLRTLREKYPKVFLMVEGLEAPGGNAKNCAAAFDRLGHGAAVCGGSSITCAWQEGEGNPDYIAAARDAAERMKRNLSRYVTVL